jgi:hypothetical protein
MQVRTGGFRAFVDRAPRHQIIIAPLVYFIFCRIDLQGRQDFIPLLPFIAIFAAVLIVYYLDAIAEIVARSRSGLSRTMIERTAFGFLCALVLIFGLWSIFAVRPSSKYLTAEKADTADIVALLEPGDKVFIHGWTEILVLGGLTNASRYTNLDHGKDSYLDQVEPGGFEGWFQRLKAERPKVVALGRLKNLDRYRVLLSWAESSYQRREGRVFTYFMRVD